MVAVAVTVSSSINLHLTAHSAHAVIWIIESGDCGVSGGCSGSGGGDVGSSGSDRLWL